jgi:hypothetical protein
MLNGGLWRVCFSGVCKLLILERATGIEPATSGLGSSMTAGRSQRVMKTGAMRIS